METSDRLSSWVKEPDISTIRMMPVSGARTMAVNIPAMPSSMKLTA